MTELQKKVYLVQRNPNQSTENDSGAKSLGRQHTFLDLLLNLMLNPVIFVLMFILVSAIFFSTLAVQQHRAFQTHGLDLGNVDQALWNTARGRFLHFTLMTPIQSRLALHVEPILLLLVPLYWLNLGGPEILLIVQASVVALGAWPLYQIANHQFGSRAGKRFDFSPGRRGSRGDLSSAAALIFPLAYLLLPTLESAVLFDFHAVTMVATFLLFALWALERKKNTYFIVFALLAMACKEDMPLVVAMLGLYTGLARRRWRLAGLTIGISVVWFAIAFFVIQPRFAAGGNIQLDRYAWLGASPTEMVGTIITQPTLVFNHVWYQANLPGYLAALFFPTAYLALFSPLTLLPMLPTLAVNLLSDNAFTWRLEDFHYGAPLAPFLFVSAIYSIRRLGQWAEADRRKDVKAKAGLSAPAATVSSSYAGVLVSLLTLLLLTFSVVYHYYRGFTPLARPFTWPQVTGHHRQLEALLLTIPAETTLFTQSNLAPHLTHRPTLYTDFAYFTNPDFPALASVDDILLDVTAFENIGGLHQFLRASLSDSGDYQIIAARDGILHLRPMTNDAQSPITNLHSPLPTPFYTFTQPDPPADYHLVVDFDDMVRLRDYSLHFNRQEEVQVSFDLVPLRSLADVRPVLYLLDAEGQPIGATVDLQPALVWFPPDQWPVGESVRVRFNTLPWYTRQTDVYRLALALIHGDAVWDTNRRLRPSIVHSGPFATHLPGDGTLLELARIEQLWQIPHGGPVLREFTGPIGFVPIQANFDDQVRLLGYDPLHWISSTSSNAGIREQSFKLTLHWQAVSRPQNLIRFVQLIGPDGQIHAQSDSAPDHGTYPTYLWQPEEMVTETIILPVEAAAPPGRYVLHIGLYPPNTQQRLLLPDGSDHVEVTVPFFNAN